MLINQNQASKKANCSRNYIGKLKNQIPRPLYFVDVKTGVMIDDGHPAWIAEVKKIKSNKEYIPNTPDKKLIRVINTVISVITEEYDEEEAGRISGLIMEGLKDDKS
jgi:hypothetical protein